MSTGNSCAAYISIGRGSKHWSHLLHFLCKLKGEKNVADSLKQLNAIRRSQLINEDSITCVIYFNKLVDVIMRVLQHRKVSPFEQHRIVDYSMRTEFQHRGTAHAHLLISLENDPLGDISEDKTNTVALTDKLCLVSSSNI
jgi:hypothetical protein